MNISRPELIFVLLAVFGFFAGTLYITAEVALHLSFLVVGTIEAESLVISSIPIVGPHLEEPALTFARMLLSFAFAVAILWFPYRVIKPIMQWQYHKFRVELEIAAIARQAQQRHAERQQRYGDIGKRN